MAGFFFNQIVGGWIYSSLMRAIISWLGFEDYRLSFSIERMGFSIICMLVMFAASFAPLIQDVHLDPSYPTDLTFHRWSLLGSELLGLIANAINLPRVAWVLCAWTYLELIPIFLTSIDIVNLLNENIDENPLVHWTQRASLSWGWLVVLLGPLLLAGLYRYEFLKKQC